MTRRGLAALFLAIGISIVLPSIALAAVGDATGGLVPCGVSSSPDEATQCQACNIVELIQGLIMFAIGLAVPIAMAMFAYAGFLYFTSGAGGGGENISKAKGIFRNTVIGFVLVLSSWLIVNTILYTVLDHSQYPESSWFHIDCTTRPKTTTIGNVIENHLGVAPEVVPTSNNPLESGVFYSPTPTYVCDAGYTINNSLKCVNAAGEVKSPTLTYSAAAGATYSTSKISSMLSNTYSYQSQLQSICTAKGLSDCRLAQGVMAMESSGNPNVVSGAGAVGLMQMLPSTACSLNSSLAGCSSCLSSGSCSSVVQALKDPTTNMNLGVQYLVQLQNQFSTLPNVIAAYNGGAGANNNSTTCPGQTYWACTANGGYAETRAYVPNVETAMSLVK
jgi:hypothetical protein